MDIEKIPIVLNILEEYLEECNQHIKDLKDYRLTGDEDVYEMWADKKRSTTIVIASLINKFKKYERLLEGEFRHGKNN